MVSIEHLCHGAIQLLFVCHPGAAERLADVLVALSQVKTPARPKLELARNLDG
jgi:hypothetical protein